MHKRRNYFVKKRFQLNFLSKFVMLLLIESVLITGLFIYVSSDTLTTGYLNSTLRIEKTPDFFMFSLVLIMLIAAVGMGITGMILFIFLSHRIAGPLFRFEKTLKIIEEGDLTTGSKDEIDWDRLLNDNDNLDYDNYAQEVDDREFRENLQVGGDLHERVFHLLVQFLVFLFEIIQRFLGFIFLPQGFPDGRRALRFQFNQLFHFFAGFLQGLAHVGGLLGSLLNTPAVE